MVGENFWILVLLVEHIIDNFSDVQTPAGNEIFGQKNNSRIIQNTLPLLQFYTHTEPLPFLSLVLRCSKCGNRAWDITVGSAQWAQ